MGSAWPFLLKMAKAKGWTGGQLAGGRNPPCRPGHRPRGPTTQARKVQPDKVILKLNNFLDQGFYSKVVDALAAGEEITDEQ